MRPISSLILSFFAALLLLSACTGQQLTNDLTSDKGYRLSSNVGFDAASGLQLDVYSPNSVANAPVVVFFFGGRWQEGSKEAYKFVGQALAARGFVAVLPNYRLYPQVRYPTFLTDNAKAVKWVHGQIGQYGGDPAKIVVMGHSSGAYNAAMLTLNPALMKSVGGDRAWIRAMIGLAGPYDFLPLTDPDLRDLFGAPENYDQTQPMMYADGSNPPMLLMHGQDDKTVFSTNTEHLAARIQRANGPVETVIYPEMSHRKIIATMATSSLIKLAVGQSDVMFYVNDFVKRNTGANAPKPRQEAPGGLQTIVPTP